MLEGPENDSGRRIPDKTSLYADAWGVRKLLSHCLRNLRLDRLPRVPLFAHQ